MAYVARTLLTHIAAEAGAEGCVGLDRLEALTGWRRDRISDAAATLRANEMIVALRPGCWRLTAVGADVAAGRAKGKLEGGPKKPHKQPRGAGGNTFRGRIWTALRIAKKSTVRDLVERAGGTDADIHNAGDYLRQLRLAGYVVELKRESGQKMTSNGFKRFLLVKDHGPDAPPLTRENQEAADV